MKSLRRQALGLATALLALTGSTFAQVKDYRDIKAQPLRQIKVQQPKRIQLDNGMVIFLQEDHELPLIRGTANVRGGDRDLPASKAGLVDILGQAWRTGGTESRTGDQLDDFLEARAARVETGGDEDSTFVRLDVLKGDFDTVFPLFVDLLRNPAIRQDKIDLAKTQMNTGISRRNDEPGGILAREAARLGYGKDSPYTAEPEYATVASITRDDLLAFHKRFIHPNNIILGLVGDFDSAAMERKLRDSFGKWARGPQAPPPAVGGTPAKPGVYLVAKDDVNQSNIAVVHPGAPLRSDPDYPAVMVMNEILSGGFSGRLMNKIRSELGLAYGVGGGISTNWDHPGIVSVRTATRSDATMQSIDAVRGELQKLTTGPFTAEELALAKDSILNAYVFTMDSKAKILNQRVLMEFYGYPADFNDRYIAAIEKVTADDVARVSKKYVRPDQVAILVVGNPKEFDKQLTTLGTVTPIDITIPEPGAAEKSAAPAAPAASNAEGTALLQKVVAFSGGQAAIDAVKAVRTTGKSSQTTPQGVMEMEIDATTVYPDSMRAVIKMPMGEMTMVMTDKAAFMVLPGMGTRDMPGSQRDAMKAESKQELLTVLKNSGQYTFSVTGTEKLGDVDAKVLEVSIDGQSVRWLVDPANGRVLRKLSKGRGPMAQGDQATDYTEWKTFSGVAFPMAWTTTANGQKVGSTTITTVEVNPTVDPKVFDKPAA